MVPLDVEVLVDVTNPERVYVVSAELAGTLSDDRLLQAARDQFGEVARALIAGGEGGANA
jgi:hypothetical protein